MDIKRKQIINRDITVIDTEHIDPMDVSRNISLDFSNYTVDGDVLLVMSHLLPATGTTITPPILTNKSSILSLLCADDACNDRKFNFENLNNVVVTNGGNALFNDAGINITLFLFVWCVQKYL